jgi:hypothetical protein
LGIDGLFGWGVREEIVFFRGLPRAPIDLEAGWSAVVPVQKVAQDEWKPYSSIKSWVLRSPYDTYLRMLPLFLAEQAVREASSGIVQLRPFVTQPPAFRLPGTRKPQFRTVLRNVSQYHDKLQRLEAMTRSPRPSPFGNLPSLAFLEDPPTALPRVSQEPASTTITEAMLDHTRRSLVDAKREAQSSLDRARLVSDVRAAASVRVWALAAIVVNFLIFVATLVVQHH